MTAPLLTWYDLNGRTLPWRSVVTPYRTWVSEIMLQQTRVSAVIPYFERFMEELPDVSALAAVSEERLLKLWEGLGYYSRARNLQKAAKVIVSDFGGELPRTCASLKTLPGIGDYTAAAIASINFGEPVAAVDGNLLRVAARVSGCADDIMDAKMRKQFTAHLNDAIDTARPGAYNQAMMDLGATVCLPNGAPKCEICPARMMCEAYKNGLTEILPVRAKKRRARSKSAPCCCSFKTARPRCESAQTRGFSPRSGNSRAFWGTSTKRAFRLRSRRWDFRQSPSSPRAARSTSSPISNGT